MRKLVLSIALLIVGAVAGAWLPTIVASLSAEGTNVQCIRVGEESVCKGQPASKLAASWDKLGGIVDLACGYDLAGSTKDEDYRFGLSEIVAGCKGPRYVVDLSDRKVRTTLWVDNGRIARIDRWDAGPIQFQS